MPFAQFSLPITIDDTLTIEVTGSFSFSAPLLAGTYYSDGSGDLIDFLKMIADQLTLSDTMGGTWTVTDGTVLNPTNALVSATATVRITRTGGAGVGGIEFGAELASILGFEESTLTAASDEWISTGDPTVIESKFVRRYHWRPYEITANEVAGAVAGSSSDVSRGGQAALEGRGQYRTIGWDSDYVYAAVAANLHTNDAAYAAAAGFNQGDPNLALEQLWRWLRVLATDGKPPVMRYCPDLSTPADFILTEVITESWLNDLESAKTEQNRGPLRFGINIPMKITTAATTPVSGAYADLCDSGGAAPIVVTDMPDLFTQAASADVNQIFTASYTPTPMSWDTGVMTWTKVNSNPDPYICLRPRPYEEFTPAELWGSHLVAQYGGPFTISAGAAVFDLTGGEPEDFTFLRPVTWTGFARSRAAYLAPPTSGIAGLRLWMEEPSLTSFTLTMPLVLTDPISDLQAWYTAHRQDSLILNSVQTSVGYSSTNIAISVATDYSSLRSVTRQTVGSLISCDVRVTAYSMGAPSVGKTDEGNRCYRPAAEAASGSTTPMASMSSQNILGDLLQQQVCLLSTTNGVATTQRFLGAQFEYDPMKVQS